MRVVAVDWSGRAVGERRAIWLAEARDGVLRRLEDGRTRDEVCDHLLALARDDPSLVVGFDFSFSFPSWFLDEHGYATVDELWEAAERDGERWIHDCAPPFWGKRGRRHPEPVVALRATEIALGAVGSVRPKSTFQVGGAGSVGTGSIRGFPALRRLRRGGFAIWPFDAPRTPFAVEVWPRACTGAVVKRDQSARAALLDARFPDLADELRTRAVAGEDAFDAAVTALVMAGHATELAALEPPQHPAAPLEGWAWSPPSPAR